MCVSQSFFLSCLCKIRTNSIFMSIPYFSFFFFTSFLYLFYLFFVRLFVLSVHCQLNVQVFACETLYITFLNISIYMLLLYADVSFAILSLCVLCFVELLYTD